MSAEERVVFLFGSRCVEALPTEVKRKIREMHGCGCSFVVGDAEGADTLFLEFLDEIGAESVTVYHVGRRPRTNVPPQWKRFSVPAGRRRYDYYSTKDDRMIEVASVGLCVWDGHSRGSRRNIKLMAKNGKTCYVFDVSKGLWTDGMSGYDPDARQLDLLDTRRGT